MSSINIYLDGHRPQQNRRPDNRNLNKEYCCPEQNTAGHRRPDVSPHNPDANPCIQPKKGWAEKWGEENSLVNAQDPFFG